MPREEIVDLLFAGKAELSLAKSSGYFQHAAHAAKAWAEAGGGSEACVLGSEAMGELALNAAAPEDRTKLWRQALKALGWSPITDPSLYADRYGSLAVDIFQDLLSSMDFAERQKILRDARSCLSTVIGSDSSEQSAELLARKAAVLRCTALAMVPELRLGALEEAERCAALGVGRDRKSSTLLELAMSEWALARHQKTDEEYVQRLRRAESYLLDDLLRKFDVAQFATARFYRMTYRPLEACQFFPQLTSDTRNRRRLLRDAPIFAEAAIQLAVWNFPPAVIDQFLPTAASLLERAIAAGFSNARTIVALAFTRVHLEGADAGLTSLVDLHRGRGELSWDRVVKTITESKESDLPALGFALGVTSSAVLTRLGTFMGGYLGNTELCEALYRAAIQADAHDPIALTNLARFLVRRETAADLREARRLLQKAQSFADRRFRWWRAVLAELETVEKSASRKPLHEKHAVTRQLPKADNYANLKEVRQHYNRLKNWPDPQERGYQLERLIYAVARLTFGTASPSYRFSRPLTEKEHQIDSYFEHGGNKYRCECKWEGDPFDYDAMVKFVDKIDVVGVSGFVVSVAGFTRQAIEKAKVVRDEKAILLMDGDEVDMVMNLQVNFDEVLAVKRLYFDSRSEPYHRVLTAVTS